MKSRIEVSYDIFGRMTRIEIRLNSVFGLSYVWRLIVLRRLTSSCPLSFMFQKPPLNVAARRVSRRTKALLMGFWVTGRPEDFPLKSYLDFLSRFKPQFPTAKIPVRQCLTKLKAQVHKKLRKPLKALLWYCVYLFSQNQEFTLLEQKVAGTKSRKVARCFEKKIVTKSHGN